jgi:hypothetical protein
MGKQFNIKGRDGLYLSNQPTTTVTSLNYQNLLIQDYDFFPKSKNDANLFDLKNVRYNPIGNQLYGSNSIAKSNSGLFYSLIFKSGDLIPNKKYCNTFKMYFKFTGSDLGSYIFPGFSGTSATTLSSSVLNALRIKVYVQLGANLIQTTLSNLEKVVANGSTSWTAVTTANDISGGIGSIASGDGLKTGIHLSSSGRVDMRWAALVNSNPLFSNLSTNGYGFRMDVSLPDLEHPAVKTKDYKIIIKYFNIGVTTTGVPAPYTTSESVELMSNNYVYYERISVPIYTSPVGGGGSVSAGTEASTWSPSEDID